MDKGKIRLPDRVYDDGVSGGKKRVDYSLLSRHFFAILYLDLYAHTEMLWTWIGVTRR